MSEEVEEVSEIFGAIEIIGLVVGALVLLAGIIGIINIMLITIRERTKEFGVRRALGAVPGQIVRQVVVETLFLTTIAGCVGMMAGIGTLELIDAEIGETVSSFRHPTISFKIVSMAMLAMIFAGAVAGLLPALRAVAIKPVDAIRSEN